jgi:hypothetical protein
MRSVRQINAFFNEAVSATHPSLFFYQSHAVRSPGGICQGFCLLAFPKNSPRTKPKGFEWLNGGLVPVKYSLREFHGIN